VIGERGKNTAYPIGVSTYARSKIPGCLIGNESI
jgi:hypothetical protein